MEKGENQQILDEIESINKLTSKLSTEMYKTGGAQKEPAGRTCVRADARRPTPPPARARSLTPSSRISARKK
ncbi:MAG: hypothetical protein M0C28_19175 [Candidatus Moduliflexus flocculans]|nr:hypothetical protein [Candidatus Moduliflexus flocculans]